ncbi:MAG TPA: TonB-dependent receptor, partial [Opitutus sp.]|nr:TonB-dependent receptor [Opitutus sp.]
MPSSLQSTALLLRLALVGFTILVAGARGAAPSVDHLKQLTIEELMSIEVTSVSRGPMPLGDAPSALQLITQQDIRRSGATSIPEVLRLANNLNVARKNSLLWGVSARGFNTELANKLLVLVDGRTVYTPLFSGVRWEVQDYLLEDIDRVEVISGPGGSVWGANAVNGVINITSKTARDTQGFYAEAGGGNQLRELFAVRYGGQLAPEVHFRVYGKHFDRAPEALASGGDAGDGGSLRQGGFRLDATPAPQGALTVQGDYYHGMVGKPGAGASKMAGGNLLSRWSQVLADGSDLQLQFYYDRAFSRQPFAPGLFGPAGKFTDELETYDFDLQHTTTVLANQTFTWGAGYRLMRDVTKDAPALGFSPRNLRQDLFSGFAQHQLPVRASSVLTIGTKIEHNDYTGFEVEPSLRWQTALTPDQMVWTAVSRAVRTPSRIDRDIRQPSSGRTILAGGRDFRSETVLAFEGGYRTQLGEKLIGSAALFYNEYEHVRSLSLTPTTLLPLFFGNDLEGETYGVELTAKYDVLPWWRLDAGYTRLETDLRVRPGGQDFNNTLNETSDPETQSMLGSSMDLPGGLEFDARLRWVGDLVTNNSGRPAIVPSYTELDVRLGFRLSPEVEISIVGQSLLDNQHPEFGLPGPGRVEIRRSIFAKVAC